MDEGKNGLATTSLPLVNPYFSGNCFREGGRLTGHKRHAKQIHLKYKIMASRKTDDFFLPD